MSQHIEIEFKNMLTKEEYLHLITEFSINETMIDTQINHYFDTEKFQLKEMGSALRIREKEGRFELTLKQPLAVGLLETNQELTKDVAFSMLQGGSLPSGIVRDQLEKNDFPINKLQYFGSLTTKRCELQYKGGLLVLDHSLYLLKEDYELEYEVEDPVEGELTFKQLLQSFNIPIRVTENKIKRFYNQKYSLH
ncbi:CYTH domain-containing protein [Robertmurraya korlensis]|uniref:CYTH domain-containing protein n=1 Tax=Robertmurraya korlensis TaxID=519977 RepID=UPI00203C7BDA|nr:CYTH domain-containing protein [Robertmurraya korlensis]MCM3602431.1 CYTH domain-containing protein [Robertmurraya korlensis]